MFRVRRLKSKQTNNSMSSIANSFTGVMSIPSLLLSGIANSFKGKKIKQRIKKH